MDQNNILEYIFSFVWDLQLRGRTGEICRPDAVNIPQSSLTGRGVSPQRYCGNILSVVDFATANAGSPVISSKLISYQTPYR